ncbi:MAG: TIGR03960 family B12-binding radical SAM protein [Clostridia bacterium]|nr:TIGR03960 family B12-binding radical SAM protein [Clostridia bacterium]
MDDKLRPYRTGVEKPARYVGGEYNLPDFNKPYSVRMCLCFVDLYEVGMSNMGIQILYGVLNEAEDVRCERCFAPWIDLGKILKEKNIPLSSLETGTPLRDFDIVGFSIPYEMSYTNVLYMLDLAGIPFRAKDRGEAYPLIVGGGPASANPEPFIDFFDLFFIGEGEDIDLELCKLVEKYKGDRDKILTEAAKIDGIYVPSKCEFSDGICKTTVKKAVVKDLDRAYFPTKPLVPNIEIIHDRSVVELYRGCYAGCRFCQACYFYRPVRYREKETVKQIAERLIKTTGCEEMGLSSLSTGDYEDVVPLISELKDLTERKNVSLQIPSLRLDSFTEGLLERTKKSSLTFAPEAGTQRLRDVINKNVTDEDIKSSMAIAFRAGYTTVKLYFMLGLPTETDEDVLGIAETVRLVKQTYIETTGRKNIFINVSTAMFIPKPATPFQWAEQISGEEMYRRQNLLKSELFKIKGVHYAWHGADISVLEGVFARGDRRLSDVIETAYLSGCKFDGWSECFRYDLWMEALAKHNVKIEEYTGARDTDEALPWDFIDFGVKKSYFLSEWKKALVAKTTPPCKHRCNGCGAQSLASCRFYKEKKS